MCAGQKSDNAGNVVKPVAKNMLSKILISSTAVEAELPMNTVCSKGLHSYTTECARNDE